MLQGILEEKAVIIYAYLCSYQFIFIKVYFLQIIYCQHFLFAIEVNFIESSPSCLGLMSFYSELMKGLGASSRVFELMDRKPTIPISGKDQHTLFTTFM